eukprot:GHVL01025317.1.p1 GENE.GHVL01025317.1~~GHVL01025317.1.p1  ORF type:complete len:271 (+),score=50.41 GHVL01025317.1:238-1050(+)
MRAGYVNANITFEIGRLRRIKSQTSSSMMSLIADLKRKSPTNKDINNRDIMSFVDTPKVTHSLIKAGFDAVMINTDNQYLGSINDLVETRMYLNKANKTDVILIAKDIFLHPLQIAEAAEAGATTVLLSALYLDQHLEDVLTDIFIMGLQPMVECHTFEEVERCLALAVPCIVVQQWDRLRGDLHPTRAEELRPHIPDEGTLILASGGIQTVDQVRHLQKCGYDGVIVGRRIRLSDTPSFVRDVRDVPGAPRINAAFGIFTQPKNQTKIS